MLIDTLVIPVEGLNPEPPGSWGLEGTGSITPLPPQKEVGLFIDLSSSLDLAF
jgi:hypothetical protein